MANTYTKIYIHYVFSTKHRKLSILPDYEQRLWAYIGGIARSNNMTCLGVGGVQDHVYALVSIPPLMPPAKAVQLIKGGSSKWLNDNFFEDRSFKWQKGYGAFSVSKSKLPATVRYINNQKVHHRNKTFKQEYIDFLKKHKIKYDARYLFD